MNDSAFRYLAEYLASGWTSPLFSARGPKFEVRPLRGLSWLYCRRRLRRVVDGDNDDDDKPFFEMGVVLNA